jgi:hypothetical protein
MCSSATKPAALARRNSTPWFRTPSRLSAAKRERNTPTQGLTVRCGASCPPRGFNDSACVAVTTQWVAVSPPLALTPPLPFQEASSEFGQALRLSCGSRPGPCIMWNRPVLRPGRMVVLGCGPAAVGAPPPLEEPMAMEFTIREVRWERYRRVLENAHAKEWLKFQSMRGLASKHA